MIKVMHVLTDTNIGGAGVLLINRLSYTDMQKYPTLVLVPKGSALCNRLSEIGVNFIEMDCVGDRSFDVMAIKAYKRIFRRIRPNIVNCHGCLSARIAAKLCRIPVKICTRHCVFPVKVRDKVMGAVNQ